MDKLLRTHAARSVVGHLRSQSIDLLAMQQTYNDTNTATNTNTNTNTDKNNFFIIQEQQQLKTTSLINNTDFLQDANAKDNNTVYMLAASTATSTLEQFTFAAGSYYDVHTNATFADDENYSNYYSNFTCDGDQQQALSTLNGTVTYTDEEEDIFFSSVPFQITVCLLYILIFVFALLGNGLVCYIVQSTPRMRTVTNYFIANLALGDILMSLFCVPFSFISMFILIYWPFGIALCHLVNYSQAVSVLVSAYTLVAISIDRFIAIMWPLRPRITKRYAKLIIAGVWGIALITAFPVPVVSNLVQPTIWHKQCNRYICQEVWPSKDQNYYYTLALFTLQFFIPLLVLIYTYTRIALAVWGKRPPGEAENSRDQRMARSKRKGKRCCNLNNL